LSADPFNAVEAKLQEACHNLRRLETVFIRPEHTGQYDRYRVQLSCARTVLHYEWHDQFKATLHGFLAAGRSVPDIIQSTFGYDKKQKDWLDTLDQAEQDRREEFAKRFSSHFTAFNQLPLSGQRRKVIHKDGMADWHVEVKGLRKIYYGDKTTALPQIEDDPPLSDDQALNVAIFSSPFIHLQPFPKDFWLGPKGDPNRTPLFDQCRNYLKEAEKLVNEARSLFAKIHDGQQFTVPTY